jgi:hypothetical protein
MGHADMTPIQVAPLNASQARHRRLEVAYDVACTILFAAYTIGAEYQTANLGPIFHGVVVGFGFGGVIFSALVIVRAVGPPPIALEFDSIGMRLIFASGRTSIVGWRALALSGEMRTAEHGASWPRGQSGSTLRVLWPVPFTLRFGLPVEAEIRAMATRYGLAAVDRELFTITRRPVGRITRFKLVRR